MYVATYDVRLKSIPTSRNLGRLGEEFKTVVKLDVPSQDRQYAEMLGTVVHQSFAGLQILECSSVTFGSFEVKEPSHDIPRDGTTVGYTNSRVEHTAD